MYLPEDMGYLEIPYRMLSRPAISLFEHRLALKRLYDQGKKNVDEASLFRAIDELRHIVKTAASTTRSVRRHRTKMSENRKVQPLVPAVSTPSKLQTKAEKITAFENIEFW